MDRTALLQRAADVRRSIFASLPWGLRLAIVFTKFAESAGLISGWGRLFGLAFLRAGVEGMPEPGPHYNPNTKRPELTLPSNYMAQFVSSLYGLLVKKYHDPDLATDAISNYLTKIHQGQIKLEPVSLSSALSYVRHGVLQSAKDLVRKELRDRSDTDSLQDITEEEKGLSKDLEDPNALKKFQRVLTPHMWEEWMGFLAQHVHPDMPLYLHLKMEGYDSDEIVGSPKAGQNPDGTPKKPGMLPHYTPKPYDPVGWDKTYNRKVIPVSQEFFKAKHEELPGPV